MQTVLLCLTATLLVVPVAASGTCTAKGIAPSTPKHALKFCHIFPDKSCCLPAQDNEIEEHYFNLLDAGDICAKESSMAKDALKQIFCAACSPKEPEYVYTDPASGTTYFKICSSLAEKVRPQPWAATAGQQAVPATAPFDACGMVVVAERGAPCKGDDVIVPSQHWTNCATGSARQVRGGDSCGLPNTFNAACASTSFPSGSCTCAETTFNAEKTGLLSEPEDCGGAYSKCPLNWGGQECRPAVTQYGEEACDLTKSGDPETGDVMYHDCLSEYKFINDDTGAKPPFLDDYTMMIVECAETDTTCNTKCYTGAANRAVVAVATMMIAVMSAAWTAL
jgi:hypothetical protein